MDAVSTGDSPLRCICPVDRRDAEAASLTFCHISFSVSDWHVPVAPQSHSRVLLPVEIPRNVRALLLRCHVGVDHRSVQPAMAERLADELQRRPVLAKPTRVAMPELMRVNR